MVPSGEQRGMTLTCEGNEEGSSDEATEHTDGLSAADAGSEKSAGSTQPLLESTATGGVGPAGEDTSGAGSLTASSAPDGLEKPASTAAAKLTPPRQGLEAGAAGDGNAEEPVRNPTGATVQPQPRPRCKDVAQPPPSPHQKHQQEKPKSYAALYTAHRTAQPTTTTMQPGALAVRQADPAVHDAGQQPTESPGATTEAEALPSESPNEGTDGDFQRHPVEQPQPDLQGQPDTRMTAAAAAADEGGAGAGAELLGDGPDLLTRLEVEAVQLGLLGGSSATEEVGERGPEEESLEAIMALGRRPEEIADLLLAGCSWGNARAGSGGASDGGCGPGGGPAGEGCCKMSKEEKRRRKQEVKERKKTLRRDQRRQQRQRKRALMGVEGGDEVGGGESDTSSSSSPSSSSSSSSSRNSGVRSNGERRGKGGGAGSVGDGDGASRSSSSHDGGTIQAYDNQLLQSLAAAPVDLAASLTNAAFYSSPSYEGPPGLTSTSALSGYGDDDAGGHGGACEYGADHGRILASAGAAAALGLGLLVPANGFHPDAGLDELTRGVDRDPRGVAAMAPVLSPSIAAPLDHTASTLAPRYLNDTPSAVHRALDGLMLQPQPGGEYPPSVVPAASPGDGSAPRVADDGTGYAPEAQSGGVGPTSHTNPGFVPGGEGEGGADGGAVGHWDEVAGGGASAVGGSVGGPPGGAAGCTTLNDHEAFLATRDERSRHIAAQLTALQEESRQLQQQSKILQERTREIGRTVGLRTPPQGSSSSASSWLPATMEKCHQLSAAAGPTADSPDSLLPAAAPVRTHVQPSKLPLPPVSLTRIPSLSGAAAATTAPLGGATTSPSPVPKPPAAPAHEPRPPSDSGSHSTVALQQQQQQQPNATALNWSLPKRTSNPLASAQAPQRTFPPPPRDLGSMQRPASSSSFHDSLLPRWAEQVASPVATPLDRRSEQRPLHPGADGRSGGGVAGGIAQPGVLQGGLQGGPLPKPQPLMRHVPRGPPGPSGGPGGKGAGQGQLQGKSRLAPAPLSPHGPQHQVQQPVGQALSHQQLPLQPQPQQQQAGVHLQSGAARAGPGNGVSPVPPYVPGVLPQMGPLPAAMQQPEFMQLQFPSAMLQWPGAAPAAWADAPLGELPHLMSWGMPLADLAAAPVARGRGPSLGSAAAAALPPVQEKAGAARRNGVSHAAGKVPRSNATAAAGAPAKGKASGDGGATASAHASAAPGGGSGRAGEGLGGIPAPSAWPLPSGQLMPSGMMPMMLPPYGALMQPVGPWVDVLPAAVSAPSVPSPQASSNSAGKGPSSGAGRLARSTAASKRPSEATAQQPAPAPVYADLPGGIPAPLRMLGPPAAMGFPGAPAVFMPWLPNTGIPPGPNGQGDVAAPSGPQPWQPGGQATSSVQLPPVKPQPGKGKMSRSAPPGTRAYAGGTGTGGIASLSPSAGSHPPDGGVMVGVLNQGGGFWVPGAMFGLAPVAGIPDTQGSPVTGIVQRASAVEQQQLDHQRDVEASILTKLEKSQARTNSHDGRPVFRLF